MSPAVRSDVLPRRLGRYFLFDRIGKGGMAEIYLARQAIELGGSRLCVVKEILGGLAGDSKFSEMLVHEAKLAARLSHANVVQVFELGREHGRLFIAMEYVEGFDLNALLGHCSRAKVPLPLELSVHVVREALRGLDYAHRQKSDDGTPLGIVHRDVSPSNLLVSFEGEVKVCDFGIARANDTLGTDAAAASLDEALQGKAGYMSPEHARQEPVDARADVFAIGIVLWELIAGRRMYKAGDDRGSLLAQARLGEITALPERGLPEEASLHAIVAKALAFDPDDRFHSAAAMLRELEAYSAAGQAGDEHPAARRLAGDDVRSRDYREEAGARAGGLRARAGRPGRGGADLRAGVEGRARAGACGDYAGGCRRPGIRGRRGRGGAGSRRGRCGPRTAREEGQALGAHDCARHRRRRHPCGRVPRPDDEVGTGPPGLPARGRTSASNSGYTPSVLLAEVALPVPLTRAFTYSVPDALVARAMPGARAVCPFGARRLMGVILAVREGEPPERTRAISLIVDVEPAIPEELLAFLKDLAPYYFAPIGEVVRLALPPIEKETARELEEPSLFQEVRGVGPRRVQWVSPTDRVEDAAALRGQAAAILKHLRAVGAEPIAALEQQWGNARSAVRRLVDLGVASVDERDAPAEPLFASAAVRDSPHEATAAQRTAIEAIAGRLGEGKAGTFLLHGVTGSGKTEVYLRAIAAARACGRGSIVLVPEIALTPQLVARFRARFGDDVAVLHSALTPKERGVMWRRLRSGATDVAIGARSALFAPVRGLGLVVVDEEHDSSFKQEEGVRYHARDMAIWRAHRSGGVCVLGSATPSLESEHLVRAGRATKLRLPVRAGTQPLPRVEIVDLRRMGASPETDKRISMPLHRAIEQALAAREQVILFLNRRGFAPSVRCEACGLLATCGACSVALTFHKGAGKVVRCHYCDFEAPLFQRCTACGAEALVLEGLGTEKLEETLKTSFPNARVARLDRDVAGGRNVGALLDRVRAREIDILVGTQMAPSGHDLPNVTLVGVINADAALSIPDFRAGERGFQLLVQVAGRAGRGDAPGRVIVQTWDPERPAIALAARHDVDAFLERELADRKELGYPPFTRAALVRADAVGEAEARGGCARLAEVALASEGARSGQVLVQGPAPAPIARIRGRFRFRLMLRAADRGPLRETLRLIEEARGSLPRDVRTSIDVDPVQLL